MILDPKVSIETAPNALQIESVWKKLEQIEESVQQALSFRGSQGQGFVPVSPGRDLLVIHAGDLPPKKGLSSREGQARLLHDLASIELQAMELGLRSLYEFADAPTSFRQELAEITLSEASHLRLCLQGLEKLGSQWGAWPVHIQLWQAVSSRDSFLDRILIVHRYLEGSGLDAGDSFLNRLSGVLDSPLHHAVKVIFNEEIGHVEFGSRWYRQVCKTQGLDPNEDFVPRMEKLKYQVPKRLEKISRSARKLAGFTENEIQYLETLRENITKFKKIRPAEENATDPRAESRASHFPPGLV